MKFIKTICIGTLLASAFSIALVINNSNNGVATKAETTEYNLRDDFKAYIGDQHDLNAWGEPWGIEGININELFKDNQGFKLADENGKLPEYDGGEQSEWSDATLSLHTYPMFNNDTFTELEGYFNQYPDGWKITANSNPETIGAWPSGFCSADKTYLKYFYKAGAFHPGNGCGITVYFTAPKTGNIYLSDEAWLDDSRSNGTYFFIYKIPVTSFTEHIWQNNEHHGLFGGSPIYPNKGVSPTKDWSTWKQIKNTKDQPLTYQTDVFSVDKGDVIAWVYGGGDNIDYDLTYTSPKVTYVEDYDSILLDTSELKICKEENKTLGITVTPSTSATKGITWTSSDETVATVSANGEIVGINDGTAIIKATLNNGTPKTGVGEVSASCTVTVSGTESIRITNNKSVLNIAQGETLSLKYETYPLNNEIEWSVVSGSEIASVDNEGIVTGLLAGTATIRATVAGTPTYDEVSVTVKTADTPTLTLSETGSISIQPGSSKQITTSISPVFHENDDVIVNIDNTDIATASWENKVITINAVAQGSTTLTASVAGGNTVTLTINVNKEYIKTYEWEKDFTSPMPSRWEQAVISDGEYCTDLEASNGRSGYNYNPRKETTGLAYVHSDLEYFSIFGGQCVHPLVGHQACIAFRAYNGGRIDYSSHFVSQSGNEQRFKILLNNTKIYPIFDEWECVNGSHSAEVSLTDLDIEPGDIIYTIVDSGSDNASDFCFINPTIKYSEFIQSPGEVSLDKTDITLNVNEYQLIKATIDNEDFRTKKLTWSSSNEGVATVNDVGEITALHSGTALITVTLEDGNSATCTVHVNLTTSEIVGISVGIGAGILVLATSIIIVIHFKKKKQKKVESK